MEQTTMTKHGPLVQSDRIVALAERNRELAVSGKRRLGSGAMFPGDVDRSFGDRDRTAHGAGDTGVPSALMRSGKFTTSTPNRRA